MFRNRNFLLEKILYLLFLSMNKIILKIITFYFLLNSYSLSEMNYTVSKDEFEGTTSHYIKSDSAYPNKPLSFPYKDTVSKLIVGCEVDSHYWVYVYFNKLNLLGGSIDDGYYRYSIKIKTKDGFHQVNATKDFSKNFVNFDFLPSDKKTLKELMEKNDELWIQFNHYQDGERFYKYDTRGFTELFKKNCENVS